MRHVLCRPLRASLRSVRNRFLRLRDPCTRQGLAPLDPFQGDQGERVLGFRSARACGAHILAVAGLKGYKGGAVAKAAPPINEKRPDLTLSKFLGEGDEVQEKGQPPIFKKGG